MPEVRLALAFDFGLKRIGVAVGQPLTATASPVCTLPAHDGKPDWAELEKLIREWQPQTLIVGLPYNKDGSPQSMTLHAERFARQLAGRFQLPVVTVDERWSSIEAEQALRMQRQKGQRGRVTKTDIDQAAACRILERWLNEADNFRAID